MVKTFVKKLKQFQTNYKYFETLTIFFLCAVDRIAGEEKFQIVFKYDKLAIFGGAAVYCTKGLLRLLKHRRGRNA